ncbi:Crp/Fnr family transcriptional regulator [Longirhabdus pacifica]|uniref:Crp/Fnr family transcriptional regulator n=1 Tax=Longirhabdus pacifica TaxID=2305227 RepID=UPI001008A564|nr:Crp/Fnr family transcriptional regulator [Longirhabdus pacifica]
MTEHPCTVSNFSMKMNKITDYMSQKHFDTLLEAGKEVTYPSNSFLFMEEEPADKHFLVLDGQVKITKSTEEGKEIILSLLQKHDFFVEMGTKEKPKFNATGQCVTTSKILVIHRNALEDIISSDGEFALQFIKWISITQKMYEARLRDLLLFGKKGALASILIRLVNSYGKMTEEGFVIKTSLTNTELANMIGTSRENINRTLKQFREDNAVVIKQGQMIVTDLSYLKNIVMCPNCPPEICRM